MLPTKLKNALTIFILGSLTALSPFSVDMYLSAFPDVASDLGTTVARASFSLSSYFIGLALGQLIYGPLLDRFGRKRPLAAGLSLYVVASLGCVGSGSITSLVIWRFVQALGGCVASTAAFAWVRDLYSTRDSAKVFSLLVLVLAASPLLAPTVGGYLSLALGWRAIFWVLPAIALVMLFAATFGLPTGRAADHEVRLSPRAVWRRYVNIHRDGRFNAYTWSGATSFAGLFAYVAGSPALFMDNFHVSAATYGWIFASMASGVIGATQLNLVLLRRFRNEEILRVATAAQAILGVIFFALALVGALNLIGTLVLLFAYLACMGLASPNSQALALAPFANSAGTAAALMNSIQMAMGALASVGVGALGGDALVTLTSLQAIAAVLALTFLLVGARRFEVDADAEDQGVFASNLS